MIICFTLTNPSEDADIDPRFGRCAYFGFYDTQNKTWEFVENEWKNEPQGAGVKAAQFVISKGAKRVITGNLGFRAEIILKKAGIEIVYKSGKIKDYLSSL